MIRRLNRTDRMASRSFVAFAACALTLSVVLGGCGRKGNLEAPGTVDQPLSLPTVFGTSPPAAPAKEPAKKEDKPFILDPLI